MALSLVKYWVAVISLFLTTCSQPMPLQAHRPEKLISILCYHHVNCIRPTQYSISLQRLDQQIQALKKAGFSFVSLKDLENYYYHNLPLPEKSIALTFDDANKNVYTTAYPYLKKQNIPFAVFAYPTSIGHRYVCTWAELKEMAANGVTLGSHSYWHPLLTNPKRADGVSSAQGYTEWLTLQTAGSKKILEEQLGVSINYFAIPFGAADTKVLEAVKTAGYTLCVNVTGGNNGSFSDPLNLNRTLVYGQTGPRRLLELVSARTLYVTTTPNNLERIYTNELTINITVKKPERFVGPWVLELTYSPTRILTTTTTGNIQTHLHLYRQGFYIATLTNTDTTGLEYKATWLFIYTRKKPLFL
jgi:peptidoglycan/xylan/chitin deacetylase (PgdA/CDA1 family)